MLSPHYDIILVKFVYKNSRLSVLSDDLKEYKMRKGKICNLEIRNNLETYVVQLRT